MAKTYQLLTTALLLLGVSASRAGPSEVAALEEKLAAKDAEIVTTEGLMKEALGGYGPEAGQYGIELRALKRERVQIEQALQAAIEEQRKREIGTAPASVIQTDPRWKAPR